MTVPSASLSTGLGRPDRAGTVALDSANAGLRELMAVREIAQAFLSAARPSDVYQLALNRVSPLVGAAFACVYLVDDDSELMRLQAVHNWPEKYDNFLGEMRVRLGFGPSGQAASERRLIEVPDVFADPSLADWQEVARELGFRSMVALPLQTAEDVVGALAFYFSASGGVSTEGRDLLRVVADQIAATAEKAKLIDDLQRTNFALQSANSELESQYVAVVAARRLQDEFLSNLSHELRTPLTSVLGYLALLEEGLAGPVNPEQRTTLREVKSSAEKLLGLIADLLELTSLKRGDTRVSVTRFDPHIVLQDALSVATGKSDDVALVLESDSGTLPPMSSDRKKVTRLLAVLLGNAFKFTEEGEVRVSVTIRDDSVIYRITDTGVGISATAQRFVFDEFRQEDGSATRKYGGSGLGLAIARRLAQLLGGDIRLSSERNKGSSFEVELPLVCPTGT
ncbi:MAG TPA: GAF domain-containing sensor histidine kinase [Gemmatimonadaceae bacterium]|nr:GAF domain-containing sensor histidine kinase [Gemmatimonadaceae bacterium]